MNQLIPFNYDGIHRVRVLNENDNPVFVARDICEILGLSDVSKTVSRLDEDEKGTKNIPTPGGTQDMLVVTESGLYSLVLTSNKTEAKQFKRWITHEVIPSIRKHGLYATEELLNDPDLAIKAFTALKEERAKNKALTTKIEQDRPKVLFADALEVSSCTILVGELAKLLRQNGVFIGQNRLFYWLRNNSFLGAKGEYYNMPTQKSMELGLFEIKVRTVNNPDGSVRETRTPLVTGKGQQYFINKFLNKTAS